jgi:tryptophanase
MGCPDVIAVGLYESLDEDYLFGRDAHTGVERRAKWDLLRLAIPRRVYTRSHMDYVIEAIAEVWQRRDQIRGLKIVSEPPYLRHFSARFERV